MKVLLINGSPKKKGGASRFFSRVFRPMLLGCHTNVDSLHEKQSYARILEQFLSIDALILSVPLYIDGIPAHVQEFLEEAEDFSIKNNCQFNLYVISNNGFIEGRQNHVHLKMYQCWCERTGITWGGGIGIGGGVMLRFLAIVFPIILSGYLLNALLLVALGYPVPTELWLSLLSNGLIYGLLNAGVLFYLPQLAWNVRRGQVTKNRFTRAMIPSFIFIPCADAFMMLSSLFHGRFIFAIMKKDVNGNHIH